jgi:succinate dehydrogenase flavin-adding protein (antitoxin of CptAB toxin-antitoxin module)
MIFSLFLLTQINFAQTQRFPNSLIYGRNGRTFVKVTIKTPKFNGLVLITNQDFFSYLNRTKNFNEKQYEQFVSKIAECSEIVILKEENFEQEGFERVNSYPDIDALAAKGKDIFIAHYFEQNYLVMEKVKTYDELIAIADKLLNWGIKSHIDDRSGLLTIPQ